MIKDQLSLGIIEPVNEDGPLSRDDCIHYLPHYFVVKQNRSNTKVRMAQPPLLMVFRSMIACKLDPTLFISYLT